MNKDSYFAVKVEYHHGVANYIECFDRASAKNRLDEIRRTMNKGDRVYHYLEGNRLVSLENVRDISIIDHDEGYYPVHRDFNPEPFKK